MPDIIEFKAQPSIHTTCLQRLVNKKNMGMQFPLNTCQRAISSNCTIKFDSKIIAIARKKNLYYLIYFNTKGELDNHILLNNGFYDVFWYSSKASFDEINTHYSLGKKLSKEEVSSHLSLSNKTQTRSDELQQAQEILIWIRTKLANHSKEKRPTSKTGFELNGGGVEIKNLGLFSKSAARAYNDTSTLDDAVNKVQAIAEDLRSKGKITSGFCGWGARSESTAKLYREIVEYIDVKNLSRIR